MSQDEEAKAGFWIAGGGMVAYCLILTIITGDIGFEGDDWWIFSWPYWNSFPASLLIYAKESLRPVEGLYWIGLFELFGFNKVVFHFFSLMLLAGSSLAMGYSLLKAFPNRPCFAILAALTAFFLPTLSCLTYVVATDNSRLCLLLFWTSTILFQKWRQGSGTWLRLAPSIIVYVIAFMTYEAATLLIFVMPMLVWPIHVQNRSSMSDRDFFRKMAAAVAISFFSALFIRFTFLNGGAVSHSHLVPPFELIWSYIALIPFYIAAPFGYISTAPMPCILGTVVAIGIGSLILYFSKLEQNYDDETDWTQKASYLYLLGLAIVLLGMFPYQLAGYGNIIPKIKDTVLVKWGLLPEGSTPWFNFHWSSRIYSASSFGLAIILAAFATCWKKKFLIVVGKIAPPVALAIMAMFHADLSADWREAAEIRNNLVGSLISNVPEVKPNTNFVFLDLESYHKRVAVFRGWGGLRELVRMLYEEPKLNAWYLYPYSWKWPNQIYQQAIVSPRGFVSRGLKLNNPAPHDTLLLLRRSGWQIVPLEKITSHDGVAPTGIAWKGITSIKSNFSRVIGWSEIVMSHRRLAKNAWNTRLISTLHLSRIRTSFNLFNKWTVALRHSAMKRHLLRK